MNRQHRRISAALDRKSGATKNTTSPLTALAGLEDVATQLQEIIQTGDQMTALAAQLELVLTEVETARKVFSTSVRDLDEMHAEQARQRWVFMRMLAKLGSRYKYEFDTPVSTRRSWDTSSWFKELERLESTLRTEYDSSQVGNQEEARGT